MAKFIDIKFRVDTSAVRVTNARRIREIQELPQNAYKFFVARTPIAPVNGGNARRSTRLERGDTIHADYAYAGRLDTGWSKQAPRGMTRPTQDFIVNEFKRIFRKK